MFELSLRLATEEIDSSNLLEAIRVKGQEEIPDEDEDGDIFVTRTLGHHDASTDYHGHLSITLAKEGDSRIDLRYHADTIEIKDEEPPYIEEIASWLSRFIAKEEISGRINVAYTFDKSFAPTIALPFPLATSEKALTGASVTGISIQFPDKDPLDMAVVSRAADQTYVSIIGTSNIRLKEFDVLTELQRLAVSVDSLIRRQEPDNETGNTQQTE